MPPMSEIKESLVRPRTTNFSIDAIMGGTKVKEEIREEEEEEEVEVGVEEQVAEVVKDVKKEKKAKVGEKSNCDALNGVKCTLDNKELWDKFAEFGTEMIITRTGRRMFPTVRCSFANLDMEAAGPGTRLYCHPDAPFTGEQLKKQVVSFEKVKVTNNESDNTGQVILNSMHKFQPRIYLVMRAAGENGPVTDIEKEKYRTFVFPETQFTAVTAYQNQLITKLKIESNPFAKGFRDSSSMYDSDDSMSSPYGFNHSSLPGGLPGMDPFSHQYLTEDNNNRLMAAEKARQLIMMQRTSQFLPQPSFSMPSPALPLSPELLARYNSISPDMLARYSAMQAGLGLYNPALLAAALKSSPPSPTSLSPTEQTRPNPRYSPYTIPMRISPSSHSPASDGENRTPSPGSSPHSIPSPPSLRLPFPIFR